jgi:ribosome biogenesis GTPase / thiamine phosphate phosphatase
LLIGTVTALLANYYWVTLDPGDWPCEKLLCKVRSRLRKTGQQVFVGDRVEVQEPDWEGGRGAIARILPRTSTLDRPAVANADQVLLMVSTQQPAFEPVVLSRFLNLVEHSGLKALVCINKVDLVDSSQERKILARVSDWGYQGFAVSVSEQRGFEALEAAFQGSITVLAGPSGVGKSSLLNRLCPGLTLRTGEVSDYMGKGKHTTRHVELFALPKGGYVADTPGFSQLELSCDPQHVAHLFPEFRPHVADCRFRDCLHRNEPDCAVIQANLERHEYYLDALKESEQKWQIQSATADAESVEKVLSQASGNKAIPKLKSIHRTRSKRTERQELAAHTGLVPTWTDEEEDPP